MLALGIIAQYFFTKSWQRHLIQRLAATCDSYAIDAFICLSVPKRLRAFWTARYHGVAFRTDDECVLLLPEAAGTRVDGFF